MNATTAQEQRRLVSEARAHVIARSPHAICELHDPNCSAAPCVCVPYRFRADDARSSAQIVVDADRAQVSN